MPWFCSASRCLYLQQRVRPSWIKKEKKKGDGTLIYTLITMITLTFLWQHGGYSNGTGATDVLLDLETGPQNGAYSVQFQLGGLTWGECRPATSSRSSHRPYIVMTSQIFKSPFSTRETFHKYQTSRDQKFIIERVISDLLVVRGVLSTVYRFLFGQTAFWAAGDISAAIPWVSKIRNKAEQHSWGPDCYWLHMI